MKKLPIRREIRSLSTKEWQTYKSAYLNLKKHGLLDELAELHMKLASYAHNSPLFLPWHRAFVLHFEELLRIVNRNNNLMVPYWDWTIDAADPAKSIIFSPEYWGFPECFEVNVPEKHCLLRNQNYSPFYNKVQVNRLLKKNASFFEFAEEFELVPHGIVHFSIGGQNGDMSEMWSVNDPIFWHHHSFCDLLWHKKQQSGLQTDKKILDTVLRPFGKTVRELESLDIIGVNYENYDDKTSLIDIKYILSKKQSSGAISSEIKQQKDNMIAGKTIKSRNTKEDRVNSDRKTTNHVFSKMNLNLKNNKSSQDFNNIGEKINNPETFKDSNESKQDDIKKKAQKKEYKDSNGITKNNSGITNSSKKTTGDAVIDIPIQNNTNSQSINSDDKGLENQTLQYDQNDTLSLKSKDTQNTFKSLKSDSKITNRHSKKNPESIQNKNDIRTTKTSKKQFEIMCIYEEDNEKHTNNESEKIIPGIISEHYCKKHGYNIQKVREVEEFMRTGKKKYGWIRRILNFFFCLSDDYD